MPVLPARSLPATCVHRQDKEVDTSWNQQTGSESVTVGTMEMIGSANARNQDGRMLAGDPRRHKQRRGGHPLAGARNNRALCRLRTLQRRCIALPHQTNFDSRQPFGVVFSWTYHRLNLSLRGHPQRPIIVQKTVKSARNPTVYNGSLAVLREVCEFQQAESDSPNELKMLIWEDCVRGECLVRIWTS